MEFDFSKNINESAKLKTILSDEKTRKQIAALPDTAFAYIEPGGKKTEGKTVPHCLRHFPVYNESSVKCSLAEVEKSSLPTEGKAKAYAAIQAKASAFGVQVDEDMALAAERYDGKTRSELEDSAFLDPKRRSFPVVSCKNVRAAVSTWGMYKGSMTFDEFKRKLTARAKKLGCESSLPKAWKDEASAKDWEKIDTDELKRDDKKEKKEHHKDAVEDDKDKIKKLKKGKPSEKKSVEIHDLKKDIKYDKKKEAQAMSDKQKAAKEKFLDMIKKKKGGDDEKESKDDDKKKDEKSDASSPYNTWSPVNNLDMEKEYAPVSEKNKADDESLDKEELKRDDKKEKKEHEKDAIKDDEKQIKDLKKDEDEDKKDIKEDDAMMKKYAAKMENDHAMLKMKSRMGEIDKARKDMEVEKAMMQKKLDAMMKKMRAADAS